MVQLNQTTEKYSPILAQTRIFLLYFWRSNEFNFTLFSKLLQFKNNLGFLGMPNELELEKVGIDLVEKKQLWAAVVFTNLDDNPSSDYLPEFIQVSNFQKVTFVHPFIWKHLTDFFYIAIMSS